jgi:hypothetical protein
MFDLGDYERSARLAEDAIRYAERSDRHITGQLIGEAKRLLDWADSENVEERFPNEYTQGKDYYETSLTARDNREWSVSINSAIRSIEILSWLESGRTAPLPRYYTVRSWRAYRDCFWTIAGRPWVFGDSWRWRELYEANRERLPNPNNPNLIEPGFVIEIPSIRGEVRQGMWDPTRTYE